MMASMDGALSIIFWILSHSSCSASSAAAPMALSPVVMAATMASVTQNDLLRAASMRTSSIFAWESRKTPQSVSTSRNGAAINQILRIMFLDQFREQLVLLGVRSFRSLLGLLYRSLGRRLLRFGLSFQALEPKRASLITGRTHVRLRLVTATAASQWGW